MTHYKTLLDPGLFIGPQDFPTDKTLTVSRIVRENLPARDGEAVTAAPMIYFTHAGKELPRKFKVPKSVLYGMSLELGTDSDAWAGKPITLFAAKCMSFGEVEECVRVRFTQETESKIRKWMKKRKANGNAYMLAAK